MTMFMITRNDGPGEGGSLGYNVVAMFPQRRDAKKYVEKIQDEVYREMSILNGTKKYPHGLTIHEVRIPKMTVLNQRLWDFENHEVTNVGP